MPFRGIRGSTDPATPARRGAAPCSGRRPACGTSAAAARAFPVCPLSDARAKAPTMGRGLFPATRSSPHSCLTSRDWTRSSRAADSLGASAAHLIMRLQRALRPNSSPNCRPARSSPLGQVRRPPAVTLSDLMEGRFHYILTSRYATGGPLPHRWDQIRQAGDGAWP